MIRKKTKIDGMDREIIRTLYPQGIPRTLSGASIADKVNLSPPAIKPRLVNLQKKGIIKPISFGGMRTFKRTINNKIIKIKAPSKIMWGLDIKNELRKDKEDFFKD